MTALCHLYAAQFVPQVPGLSHRLPFSIKKNHCCSVLSREQQKLLHRVGIVFKKGHKNPTVLISLSDFKTLLEPVSLI